MRAWVTLIALVAALAAATLVPIPAGAETEGRLREADEFKNVSDLKERSRKLFDEAGRVLKHARCVNCHPKDDRPRQGTGVAHEPPVRRGAHCATCHPKENFEPGGVPGHPKWELAPKTMAWQDQPLGDICRQLKDPARNGKRSLDRIIDHVSYDTLVGWAWKPGAGREPAPGTQAIFAGLLKAWVEFGARCRD